MSVSGGTGSPRFQWQRNGVDVSGATSATYQLSGVGTADDGATFRVVVRDDVTTLTSAPATLTVTANQVPVPSIVLPTQGATYGGGQTIQYQGSATDPEDGTLPPSAFTWEVVFHHNTHTHDFVLPVSGSTSGSFTVPAINETATDVFYRIHLTVRDSAGATTHVYRDVLPRLTTMTLATDPPGLAVTLDGLQVATPATVVGVEGITRTLGVVQPQVVDGTSYVFGSWSDGGAASHTISTPVDDTTYTARYVSGPAATALLVVGDPASLGTDSLVRSRLESLGYAVTVRDDAAATAADATGKSLVLVSSSVASAAVSTKFRTVTVPVLIYKPYLYDDMLMTGLVAEVDYGTVSGVSSLAVLASAHPLAAGAPRTVTLTSTTTTLPRGVPASTGDVVATAGGKPVLFTYSPGDALLDGRPAPACRVAFPAYGTALGRYTADGWTLFDQTVAWMTGGCRGA